MNEGLGFLVNGGGLLLKRCAQRFLLKGGLLQALLFNAQGHLAGSTFSQCPIAPCGPGLEVQWGGGRGRARGGEGEGEKGEGEGAHTLSLCL